MVRFLIASAVLVGCYSPSYDDCQFRCSTIDTCPDNLECVVGMCRLPGMSGECGSGGSDAGDGDGGMDAMVDASTEQWTLPFEVELGTQPWSSPSLNPTETEIILELNGTIYRATRSGGVWNPPQLALAIQTGAVDTSPVLARNPILIYFGSTRSGPATKQQIYRAQRSASGQAFNMPEAVPQISSLEDDNGGSLTTDFFKIVFTSNRNSTQHDLWTADFNSTAGMWLAPMALSELNSTRNDTHPVMTSDALHIVFSSDRDTTTGYDIYIAHRTSTTQPFSDPVKIPALSTPDMEVDPWISDDGNVIYLAIGSGTSRRIYRSQRM